jgi:predicted TIM-barrel fold metal-dependent hydrolase
MRPANRWVETAATDRTFHQNLRLYAEGNRETIDHCFRGLTAEARERVLWKNAAELYRL